MRPLGAIALSQKTNGGSVAIFHLSMKIISRKTGRSSTAAAAYRAGEKIKDERTGETFDYTKRNGVVSRKLVLPEGSPEWSRAELWNAVEAKNKRKDAQVAREMTIALPNELSKKERGELALEFSEHIAKKYEVGVDLAIHLPDREGDKRNHHAHLLMTTNKLDKKGLGNKVRELDPIAKARGKDKSKQNAVEELRETWSDMVNKKLGQSGTNERVDHRSLASQGINRIPTKHLGHNVISMQRKGKTTDRFEQHKATKKLNAQIINFEKAKAKLERKKVELEEKQKALKGSQGGGKNTGIQHQQKEIQMPPKSTGQAIGEEATKVTLDIMKALGVAMGEGMDNAMRYQIAKEKMRQEEERAIAKQSPNSISDVKRKHEQEQRDKLAQYSDADLKGVLGVNDKVLDGLNKKLEPIHKEFKPYAERNKQIAELEEKQKQQQQEIADFKKPLNPFSKEAKEQKNKKGDYETDKQKLATLKGDKDNNKDKEKEIKERGSKLQKAAKEQNEAKYKIEKELSNRQKDRQKTQQTDNQPTRSKGPSR